MAARVASPVALLGAALAAASAMLGLAAGVDPRYAVAGALGLAFVLVVLQDLTLGVCLMAALAFLDEIPALGAFSLPKVLGVLLGVSWLATAATRGGPQLTSVRPVLTYVLVLFLGWNALSLAWAEDSAATVSSLTRYAPNVILVPIVFAALAERRDLVRVLAAVAAGALTTALLAVYDPASEGALDDGRAQGLAGGSNELAASLVVGVVLCLAFAVARSTVGPAARRALLFGSGLCALGIFLSLSRGGLVALGAALVAAVFVGGRWRGRALVAAVGLVGAAVTYFTVFASLPARERVTEVGGGTGRTDLWTVGWRMVEDRPFQGVGAGNFPVSSIHYLLQPGAIARDDFIISTPKVAHNTVLEVLAETGVVGGVLFLLIVGASLTSLLLAARAFARAGDHDMDLLARGLLVGLVGYLVAACFISANYDKLLWVLLALGPGVLRVARRVESSSA